MLEKSSIVVFNCFSSIKDFPIPEKISLPDARFLTTFKSSFKFLIDFSTPSTESLIL